MTLFKSKWVKLVLGKDTVISYTYDGLGNRISKSVKITENGNTTSEDFTYYIRDVQGNILSTYSKTGASLVLDEQMLYGSDLLGVWKPENNSQSLPPTSYAYFYNRKIGNKQYSIKDHLGNVRVTFADVKIPANGQLLDFYTETQSVSTYYPFGWEIKPLSWAFESFKFGFNGQEKSSEISNGNYTAKFWEYDSRIGKRWNLDPKPNTSFSPYLTFANNPVWFSDVLGDTVEYKTAKDKERVWKYINPLAPGKSKPDKKGQFKIVGNPYYRPKFAAHIRDLDSRKEVYEIGETDPNSSYHGVLKYLGDEKFEIQYSNPDNTFGGGADVVLFEEVFHAIQFTQGKLYFEKTSWGEWDTKALDAEDEWEAKRFAITAPSFQKTFKMNGFAVSTQLGFIAKLSKANAIKYLVEGKIENLIKTIYVSGQPQDIPGEFTHGAPYFHLKDHQSQETSKFKERIFNSKYAGYPKK